MLNNLDTYQIIVSCLLLAIFIFVVFIFCLVSCKTDDKKDKTPKPIPVGKRAPMFHTGMEVMIKQDVFTYHMLGYKDMELCKDLVFKISAKFESDDAGIWYEIHYEHFEPDSCVGSMWEFVVPESYLRHPPKDRADPRTLIYVSGSDYLYGG